MKHHIPNLLTLANLFCGCCALVFTFHDAQNWAAWCLGGCFFFDYLDGMVARALGVQSPLGKELDSLADCVSFGVVPGALVYQMLVHTCCGAGEISGQLICPAALPAFALSAFGALRLGKFNLDTRQAKYFIGMTTPACTVVVLGLALAARHDQFGLRQVIENQWFLYALVAALAWLMNSEIPMFGMKIKSFGWRDNVFNFAFAAVAIGLLIFLKELGMTAAVLLWVAVSMLFREKVVQP